MTEQQHKEMTGETDYCREDKIVLDIVFPKIKPNIITAYKSAQAHRADSIQHSRNQASFRGKLQGPRILIIISFIKDTSKTHEKLLK